MKTLRPLILVLAIAATLPAAAANDADRGAAAYERALVLIAKDERKGAMIELKNAVQAAPSYLPAWLKLGELYLDFGYGQLAEGAFERASALGADPSLTQQPRARSYLIQGKLDELLALDAAGLAPAEAAALHVIQGNALLEVGESAQAMQRFEEAMKLDADSAAPRWGMSLVSLRAGDTDAARRHADAAVAMAPDAAESWYVRAEIERQAGKRDAALADFSHAIEVQDTHMPARLGRAALLMDAGRLDEAAADLERVRAAQPDDLQAMHLQAMLYATQGRIAESEQILAEARKRLKELPERVVNGNLPSLMLSAVIALKDRQPATAIEHLTRYLGRVEGHLGANKLLAAAYLQNAQVDEARAILEPLMVAHNDDAAIVSLLGTAYARAGDNTLASAMLERAIELGADTPAVRQQLGFVQLAGGDTKAALDSFGKAASVNPDGNVSFMLALTALRQGSLDDAQRAIDSLIAKKPSEPAYHNFNGSLALMRDQRDAARAAWRKALAIDADYPPALANLAALARTEGRADEATALYERILAKHPSNADALRGLAELANDDGRPAVAMRRLRELLQHHPGDANAGLLLVQWQLAARDYDGARADVEVLRRRHPADVRPLLLAVDIMAAEGTRDGISDALTEALEVARPDVEAMRLVMLRQVQHGELEAALVSANEVLDLRPDEQRANQEVGELEIRLGYYPAATARARALDRAFPESPVGPGLRAKLALAKGDATGAVDALKIALARAPDLPDIAVALAQARLAAGDSASGIAELKSLAGHHPTVLPLLSDALLAAGRWQDAASTLEQLLAREPANRAALNNLAWAYHQAGDTRAVASARRLLEVAPDDAASMDTAGWVLIGAGEVREGVRILRNALTRAPKEGAIRYHLAAGLAKLGEKGEAIELLKGIDGPESFPEQAAALELRRTLHAAL